MKIGILAKIDDKGTIKVDLAYHHYFSYFCPQIKIINPLDDEVENVNLLVLPGGEDVAPSRYGQKPHVVTGKPNIYAEYFDCNVLPKYIKQQIPIFGICRGFQTINVVLKGTLQQDILQQRSTKDRGELVDKLIFENNIPFQIEYETKNKYMVNSLHHQGIMRKNLSEQFKVLAYNKEFENIEAIIHKDLPIIAVQWHPEEIHDSFSTQSIRYLLQQ